MKKKNSHLKFSLLLSAVIWLAATVTTPAFADNAVKLKILLLTTGEVTEDAGYAYIKPVLDEMGVPYDVLNSKTQDLTAAMLASNAGGASCLAAEAGCVGNYNGIILTDAGLNPAFTPSEWDMLHNYQKNFGVRQAVLSGWPGTYWDPEPPFGVYLDYGLVFSSSGTSYEGKWDKTKWTLTKPTEVFEYVNLDNPFPITDFAFAANPRNDTATLRDGSTPKVEPLLTTQNGEALLSIVRYADRLARPTGKGGHDLDHKQCHLPHPFEGSGLRVHQLGDAGRIHWRALCSYGDPSGRFVPGQQYMESRPQQ